MDRPIRRFNIKGCLPRSPFIRKEDRNRYRLAILEIHRHRAAAQRLRPIIRIVVTPISAVSFIRTNPYHSRVVNAVGDNAIGASAGGGEEATLDYHGEIHTWDRAA